MYTYCIYQWDPQHSVPQYSVVYTPPLGDGDAQAVRPPARLRFKDVLITLVVSNRLVKPYHFWRKEEPRPPHMSRCFLPFASIGHDSAFLFVTSASVHSSTLGWDTVAGAKEESKSFVWSCPSAFGDAKGALISCPVCVCITPMKAT